MARVNDIYPGNGDGYTKEKAEEVAREIRGDYSRINSKPDGGVYYELICVEVEERRDGRYIVRDTSYYRYQ